MAELPASWNLKVKKKGNRAQIVQKGKDGQEHQARLCEGPEVSEEDVRQIALHDGETNTSRDIAMRAKAERDAYWKRMEATLDDDYAEPAERVAYAGLHRGSLTVGYSRKYAVNFEKAFEVN